MNRTPSSLPTPSAILVEALEPRIAPAGLLNESKFTSITLGTPIVLDASGGANDFQGLTTGSGPYSGSYLLYLTTGKAIVYTTDLNGDGQFEPNEITGISLGTDSLGRPANLILFTNVNGDIVTNMDPGPGTHLTDSDNNPNNGRDGRVLEPTDVGSITLRTLTDADIDTTVPGNTVANRLALTSFSIFGNIYVGGNFGNSSDPTSGLHIDTSGAGALSAKFSGATGDNLFLGATPQIGSIETGSAVSNQTFHFTQGSGINVEGQIQPFTEPAGQHGGNIYNVSAASTGTVFSIGEIITGNGGAGAPGGNITGVTLHGDTGSYELITGDGGAGPVGGAGGSIVNFNDLGTLTGQVLLHTGAGGTGALGAGGPGGTATFATTSIAASVEVFLGNGGDGFSSGGDGSGLASVVLTAPEPTLPIGGHFVGTWHDLGDIGNTHPIFNADGSLAGYSPEAINFNDPSYFSDPVLAARLGDHYGDGVFTTNTPGQIVVVFGDGAGGLNDNQGNFNLSGAETVYLRVPGVVNPVVTVGDFNGDGRPDIAVASADPNNFAGVYVFLDQIGTPLDPINSHNFSHNPLGDHPFSDALQSAIPSLTNLELINPTIGGEEFNVFNGPGAVVALTTGDFNGDGIADIGIVQEPHFIDPGRGNPTGSLIGILFGEPSLDANGNATTHTFTNTVTGLSETRNAASGFFHANLAPIGAAPTLQFILTIDQAAMPVLKASSLAASNFVGSGTTPNSLGAGEVMFYAVQGQKFATEILVSNIDPNTHLPIYAYEEAVEIGIGTVDTNRLLPQGSTQNITTVQATVQDFTLADLDNDGNMDFIFLSKTPLQFLVTLSGDGVGDFTVRSSPMMGQNDGIFLAPGTDTPATILTFAAVDTNQDGVFDEFGLLQLSTAPLDVLVTEVALGGTGNINDNFYQGPGVAHPGAPVFTNKLATGSVVEDQAVYGIDAFYPVTAFTTPTEVNHFPATAYGVISPDTSDIRFEDLYILGDDGSFYARYYTESGYFLNAGNGGNSSTGAGGKGGALGAPTLTADSSGGISGAIQITFPASEDYSGQAFLLAGNGGSGFGGGGNGGSVEGVAVRYAAGTTVLHSDVVIIAGNGGNAVAGNGGIGGGIDSMSVQTGVYFASGNGGAGVNGGAGGGIVGNGTGTTFDTSDGNALITQAQANAIGLYETEGTFAFSGVGLSAGNGGQGSSVGGNGGGISGWDAAFNPLIGGVGSSLYYATGFGGSAAGGIGGNGGAITNSSPDATLNNLAGDLHLQTGVGGSGLTGGDGGAITTFVNQPTDQAAVPGLLSVTTGSGGAGIVGNGGAGGAITGFRANATGLTSEFVGFPFIPGDALTGVGRVIAGDGGPSFGSQGGLGGAISNIVAQTISTPIVVAAGAGGVGLTVGGDGGSVTGTASSHTIINSAAQIGKVLIVAGVGGDAMSALPQQIAIAGDPDTNDIAHIILATGGVAPMAGSGGNISDVTQPTSAQTAVDLIAGNGGSTINAGTSLDPTTGVGRGGSVADVALTGTVGAVSRNANLGVPANPPIQSYAYTDALGTTQALSISAIVDLIANPNTPIFSFFDNTTVNGLPSIAGNVGIVAGAAGRVRSSQPAQDSVEGSVQNISAQSIMSIVAGSVASVAPVNVLSGITLTDPDGVLGVDRTPVTPTNASSAPNGRLDYFTPAGVDATNLMPGYSLVNADGAIFAINIQQTSGTTLTGPRVFPAAATVG